MRGDVEPEIFRFRCGPHKMSKKKAPPKNDKGERKGIKHFSCRSFGPAPFIIPPPAASQTPLVSLNKKAKTKTNKKQKHKKTP